jgi:hypothetical protein
MSFSVNIDKAGRCIAQKCKKEQKQLCFCKEHYDHFKFGLIKKNGMPALDYEKKCEHYNKRKVA